MRRGAARERANFFPLHLRNSRILILRILDKTYGFKYKNTAALLTELFGFRVRKGRPKLVNTQLRTRHCTAVAGVCSLRALPRGWGAESLSQLIVVQFHSSTAGVGFGGTFGFGLPGGLSLCSVPEQMQRQPRASRPSHAARYGSACLRSLECRHAQGRCAKLASLSPAALSRRA